MIQKENLLKLLVNKPVETPNENVPSYSDAITRTTDIGNKATAIFGSSIFATPYRVLSRDNLTIGYNDKSIILMDETSSDVIETRDYLLFDLFQDEEGFYGIVLHDSKIYLAYLDVDINGITPRIEYNITEVLKEASGDTNPVNDIYTGTIKINKSPIDGRFLIATSFNNQTYFAVIEYKISVGSENTYRYQRLAKSTLTTNKPLIDDMYVSWSEDNVQYAIGIINTSSEPQEKTNIILYEITGTMSSITSSIISSLSGVLCAEAFLKVNQTPQIRYRSLTDRYYSYCVVKTYSFVEEGVTWYQGDVVLSRANGNDRTELSRTTTDYMSSSQSNSYKNEADIVIINDNVFAIETILTSPNTIQATFKQLIGDTMHGKVVLSDVYYSKENIGFTLISNEFNLYKYSYQLNNTLYKISSVFKPNGYNGEPYLDRKSLVSTSGELYDITSEVAFARNLYNKSLVGDTINSIIHIPSNYLNENPIIREKLISETNDIIDDADEEIEKNEYEELYINFVDTFKVWDKNDKSVYQQKASYELANQLQTELKMYVANFRVTNNDGTIVQSNLSDIPIVNGEGVLEICFEVKEGGARTFEILDQNYEIVFATIDLSNLEPGAYRLTEKIKVEG